MENRIELSSEIEKDIRTSTEQSKRGEITSGLEKARKLYPDFNIHCEKCGFDIIVDVWRDLLDYYTVEDIRYGFWVCLRRRNELFTPADVRESIAKREKTLQFPREQEENERNK
jgi:hypothetical protein